MSATLLSKIHRQRIGVAVAAAHEGPTVKLRIDGEPDDAFLVWRDAQRHVIARGSLRSMQALLPVAQAEFARQMTELTSQGKERGTATG